MELESCFLASPANICGQSRLTAFHGWEFSVALLSGIVFLSFSAVSIAIRLKGDKPPSWDLVVPAISAVIFVVSYWYSFWKVPNERKTELESEDPELIKVYETIQKEVSRQKE